MKKFRDKNFGKHPDDPEYDHSFDEETERDAFEYEQELREQMRREK